jgi:hypothetical protein
MTDRATKVVLNGPTFNAESVHLRRNNLWAQVRALLRNGRRADECQLLR